MMVLELPNGEKATIAKHCELAEHFGVNRRTINYWRERGMPYLVKKHYRTRVYTYHLEKVEEWVSKWSEYQTQFEERMEKVKSAKSDLAELQSKFSSYRKDIL